MKIEFVIICNHTDAPCKKCNNKLEEEKKNYFNKCSNNPNFKHTVLIGSRNSLDKYLMGDKVSLDDLISSFKPTTGFEKNQEYYYFFHISGDKAIDEVNKLSEQIKEKGYNVTIGTYSNQSAASTFLLPSQAFSSLTELEQNIKNLFTNPTPKSFWVKEYKKFDSPDNSEKYKKIEDWFYKEMGFSETEINSLLEKVGMHVLENKFEFSSKKAIHNNDFYNLHLQYLKDIDARRFFYDSSIWFRYKYDLDGEEQDTKLDEYKQRFQENYKLHNAKISRMFSIRLFENSWVAGGKSDHGRYITPFKFHSETLMGRKADEARNSIFEILNKQINRKDDDLIWEWKIVLIDDHVKKNLSGASEHESLTKFDVIANALHLNKTDPQTISLEDTSNNITLKFNFELIEILPDNCQSIENTDLLMLDYLFSNDKNSYKFADSFINKIESEKKIKSVFGKYWILPISAFNFVFLDSIFNSGKGLYNQNTVISTGGDPICTPNLFRYRFYELLKLQLNEFATSIEKEQLFFKDILEKISITNYNFNFQEKARQFFPPIVFHLEKAKKLLKFKDTSDFSKSAMKYLYFGINDKSLIDQIQEFYYLLAYGDVTDIPLLEDICSDFNNQAELQNYMKDTLSNYIIFS